jgi:flagellar capping protein FliD
MASINPLSGAQSQQSPLETLLAAYRAQQERPLQALRERQQLLQSQRNLLSSLRNTLQELLARAVDVAQRGTNPFAARKVESSSPDIATASADSSAILSSVTLFVERTAADPVRNCAAHRALRHGATPTGQRHCRCAHLNTDWRCSGTVAS